MAAKPYTFDRVVRLTLGAAFLWALVWLLDYLSDVLIPFALALVLAYLMNPLVNLIQRRVKNRLTAVLLTLLIVLLAATLVLMLVIPMVSGEIESMGRLVQDTVNNSELAQRAKAHLPDNLWMATKDYLAQEEVQEFFETERFSMLAKDTIKKVLPGVWGLITGATSLLLSLIGLAITFLYLVFLMLDYNKIRTAWRDMLPQRYRQPVTKFVDDFSMYMNRYFRGQALVAAIVGVLFAIGFVIIDLPMAILMGLFIGLLNIVPYLQIVGLIPALALAILHALQTGSSVWGAAGMLGLVFVIVQSIQDGLLVPRIMGKVTGLSPAIILLSLSIWGKLLGIFGLLIALPMTCILLTYYRLYLQADADDKPEEKDEGGEEKDEGGDLKPEVE